MKERAVYFVIHRSDQHVKYLLVFHKQDGRMYLLFLLPYVTTQGYQSLN